MKKLYYLLTMATMVALVGLSAFAISSSQSPAAGQFKHSVEQLAAKKAAAPRTAKKATAFTASPLAITGGTDGTKTLYGATYYVDDSESLYHNGVAEIDANGRHKMVSNEFETMTGCYFNGKFLSIQYGYSYIYYNVYDAETWDLLAGPISYTMSSVVLPFDLTYDPTTDRIYGCFVGRGDNYGRTDESYLGWINLDNALDPVTLIGDMAIDGTKVRMRGMASTKDGVIYGIGLDNVLYTINKNNGSLTKVAELTYPTYGGEDEDPTTSFFTGYESAEFDWDTNTLYFSRNDSNSDPFISTVNLTTGQVTDLANLGYWSEGTYTCEIFSAIFFKQQATAAGNTPASLSNLTVTPTGTELKANVEFDLPALDTEGNSLEGTLGWTVTDGENELATGEGAPGAHISTDVEFANDGFNNIVAYCTFNSVSSTQTIVRKFIGCDTPALPTRPDVYPQDDTNSAIIIWRSALSQNGGNMDPVTYKVVRMPDGKVIEESTSDTAAEDFLDNDNKYRCYYVVTPTSGAKTGDASNSRETYVGTYFTLPHQNTFDEELTFNQYPVIDGNKDNNTWWVDVNSNRQAAVYSGSNIAANDYLCVGPFKLDAGSEYTFQMSADNHSGSDRVAVYVGTDCKDAGTFTHELIMPTVVNALNGTSNLEGKFTPETSGTYYFGVKACGDANTIALYIYDLKITGVAGDMPAAPQVTSESGLSSVKFNITVPKLTKDGSAAANATAVRIYRGGSQIAEITENVHDGATITYTDDEEGLTVGQKSYVVTAVNQAGEGAPCTVSAYVGLDTPGAPRNMRVYEDINTPGLMHVTWDAPTIGSHGGYIDPAGVTYSIDWLSFGVTGTGASNVGNNTSFTLQLTEEACVAQDIIAFSVKSSNATGQGGSETHSGYFGPAKSLPLTESWTGARALSGIWAGESIKEDEALAESWWDYTDGFNASVEPQDGDGYFMALCTTAADGGYRLRTPRVDLNTAENPTLAFYYAYTSSAKSFKVEIAVDDQPMKTIRELSLEPDNENEWILVEIPLNEFKNSKYVQFGFSGFAKEAVTAFVCIDNFNLYDFVTNDLAVNSFTGPTKLSVNEYGLFNIQVRNAGSTDVKGNDYTVKLYKNDQEVASAPGEDINAYGNATFILEDYPLPTDPEQTVYKAVIEFDKDNKLDNNTSEELNILVINNEYPVPTNLTAESDGGVVLNWNEPDMAQASYNATTDGFDEYEAFLTEGYGNWTVKDVDGAPTVITATALGALSYPHIGEPMAWQVIDPDQAMFLGGAWYTRSGSQFLVGFQACNDGNREIASNDWLISPELKGCEQTLSFYARAGISSFGAELMDIYVSETGNDTEDFKLLAENVEVPYASDWIEYRYRLPEGTRYFAIVHKSYNRFALLIEDVTFIGADAEGLNLNLLGYNVYRNKQRITDEPVSGTSFIDTDVVDGQTYSYHVTAVWDLGESPLSNEALIGFSSIADIAPATAATISVENRTIHINGAEGCNVAVYTTSGICIAAVPGSSHTEINVASAGIYIVKVGNTIAKLAVR